jgi:hypothetical protein
LGFQIRRTKTAHNICEFYRLFHAESLCTRSAKSLLTWCRTSRRKGSVKCV